MDSDSSETKELNDVLSTKRGNRTERRLPKSSYRLASVYEGAFAFKSKEEMQQPEYPLKFGETNLAFKIEYDEMMRDIKARKKKRGGEH